MCRPGGCDGVRKLKKEFWIRREDRNSWTDLDMDRFDTKFCMLLARTLNKNDSDYCSTLQRSALRGGSYL